MPASSIKTASVVLSPHGQTVESVTKLVGTILGQAGCRACGRLINLNFQFPAPESASAGAISVATEGF